jgi:hypothetical protein
MNTTIERERVIPMYIQWWAKNAFRRVQRRIHIPRMQLRAKHRDRLGLRCAFVQFQPNGDLVHEQTGRILLNANDSF